MQEDVDKRRKIEDAIQKLKEKKQNLSVDKSSNKLSESKRMAPKRSMTIGAVRSPLSRFTACLAYERKRNPGIDPVELKISLLEQEVIDFVKQKERQARAKSRTDELFI